MSPNHVRWIETALISFLLHVVEVNGTAVPAWMWLSVTLQEGSPCRIMHPQVYEAISWLNEQEISYHVEWSTDTMPDITGLCSAFTQHRFRIVFARDSDGLTFRLFHPRASQDIR